MLSAPAPRTQHPVRKTGFILVWVLALWVLVAPPPLSAVEPSQVIYYQGVVASVNHDTGEFVILGRKDDLPDDLIVKLKADPSQVDVMTAYEANLGFTRLARGDEVEAECRLEDNIVSVDAIFIFGLKKTETPLIN